MLNIFQVPHLDSFHTGWLYCALAGACVFLLVQMVLVTQSARYLCQIFFCFDAKCFSVLMLNIFQGHSCKSDPDKCVFSLTGKIEGGLPDFQAPPFSLDLNITHEFDNGTISQWEMKYFGFGDMVSTLGAAIIIIPVIAILESVAIAKAFGKF